MKRVFASLMLVLALASCDDEEELPVIAESRDPILDGGVVLDSGAQDAALLPVDSSVPTHPKVLNTGEACSAIGRDCKGSAAQCLEISYSGAYYSGGYCTADCKSSAECGPNAECPVSEAMTADPSYAFRSTWARKCFQTCKPGVAGECRPGYGCLSLAEAYEAKDAPAPLQRAVCIPRLSTPTWDAGSHELDAGR